MQSAHVTKDGTALPEPVASMGRQSRDLVQGVESDEPVYHPAACNSSTVREYIMMRPTHVKSRWFHAGGARERRGEGGKSGRGGGLRRTARPS